MVRRRPVWLVTLAAGVVFALAAADATAVAASEDRAVTTVISPRSPRIPNTSFPFPSTSFPASTFPPSTWQPTTTLGEPPMCGDANGDETLTATDALVVLRTAVGLTNTCTMQRCDTDASGAINASDALRVLRKAVGNDVTMSCVV